MKVMIDGNGLQARAHAQDQKRLLTFLEVLHAIPGSMVNFSPAQPLTENDLFQQDVLVITTRKGDESQYSLDELACITAFVRKGGGVCLMSNHADIPDRIPNDFTRNDAVLARQFGIEIEKTFFAHPEFTPFTEFGATDLYGEHPILKGGAGQPPIRAVITKNCCSILTDNCVPLIRLSHQMIDHRNGYVPEGRFFAVAQESVAPGNRGSKGRVVVIADSGFIGSEGTNFPGLGLIGYGDNQNFAHNVIRWLGHDLDAQVSTRG